METDIKQTLSDIKANIKIIFCKIWHLIKQIFSSTKKEITECSCCKSKDLETIGGQIYCARCGVVLK